MEEGLNWAGSSYQVEDPGILEALRRGDERAFLALVNNYHSVMIRIAMIYLPDPTVAEEIAQEAWLGVLKGIQRFEGRSTLKTWIFKILTNLAMTHGKKERRNISFSDLGGFSDEDDDPAVDPERFYPPDSPRYPGGWIAFPHPWDLPVEERMISQEINELILKAIDALPASQKMVVTLRDLEGWTSEELCNVFEITETNQRVLLHRARAKVRRALEGYFEAASEI